MIMGKTKKQKAGKKSRGRKKGRTIGPGLVIAVIVCCIGLAACCNGKYFLSRWNRWQGERYLEEGKYDQAISALEKAVEAEETNPEGYILLADAYAQKEEFDMALSVLEKGTVNTDDESIYEKKFEIQKVLYERMNYVEFPFELQDFNVLGYDLGHDYFQEICEKLECPIQDKENGLLKKTSEEYGNMAAWVEGSGIDAVKHLMVENKWLFHYFVQKSGKPYMVMQYSDIKILGEGANPESDSSDLLALPIQLGDSYEKCTEVFCREIFLNSSERSVLEKGIGNVPDVILYSMYCSWGNVTYLEDMDSENHKEIGVSFYLENESLELKMKFDEDDRVYYISIG